MYTIFQQALNFKYCAERCTMKIRQDNIEYLPIPCVVNLGLSSELFMKSIILELTPNTIIQNHKLNELFNLLPLNIQEEIKQKINDDNFDSLLKDNGNVFYEMRYIYEDIFISAKYNLKFFEDLNNILYKISKRLVTIGDNIDIEF